MTRQKRHLQHGFTLIELIIVIVILGVLAVTAAPKFLDLSSDAKVSSIQTLHAAVKGAAEQSYAKAIVIGAHKNVRSSTSNPPNFRVNGTVVELKYGYPEAYAESGLDIIDLIDLSDEWEICYSDDCSSGGSSRVKIGYDTTEGTGCYVRYSEPGGTGSRSETEYGLIMVTDGC